MTSIIRTLGIMHNVSFQIRTACFMALAKGALLLSLANCVIHPVDIHLRSVLIAESHSTASASVEASVHWCMLHVKQLHSREWAHLKGTEASNSCKPSISDYLYVKSPVLIRGGFSINSSKSPKHWTPRDSSWNSFTCGGYFFLKTRLNFLYKPTV